MNPWKAIRFLAFAAWMTVIIRIIPPDYPWGMKLWDAWILDKSGFFHEVMYISAFFMALILFLAVWELLERMIARTVYIRRVKADGPKA